MYKTYGLNDNSIEMLLILMTETGKVLLKLCKTAGIGGFYQQRTASASLLLIQQGNQLCQIIRFRLFQHKSHQGMRNVYTN